MGKQIVRCTHHKECSIKGCRHHGPHERGEKCNSMVTVCPTNVDIHTRSCSIYALDGSNNPEEPQALPKVQPCCNNKCAYHTATKESMCSRHQRPTIHLCHHYEWSTEEEPTSPYHDHQFNVTPKKYHEIRWGLDAIPRGFVWETLPGVCSICDNPDPVIPFSPMSGDGLIKLCATCAQKCLIEMGLLGGGFRETVRKLQEQVEALDQMHEAALERIRELEEPRYVPIYEPKEDPHGKG